MATKLDKDIIRETTVVVDGREIQITLTEGQTISMKLKGMKSGSVEISIEALYKQLKGDIEPEKPIGVSITESSKGRVKNDGAMMSLHDIRHRCNIKGFDFETTAKFDGVLKELIDEVKGV